MSYRQPECLVPFYRTFEDYRQVTAPRWHDEMVNYLYHGFKPGSFHHAVFANDLWTAMACSHPSNDVPAIKELCNWIMFYAPKQAVGSFENVDAWLDMDTFDREEILHEKGLIWNDEEVIIQILNGNVTQKITDGVF